jgi:aspartyl-tRNA(Asn)/glutamyl-tRNA(Gln) amidotransferase subunit B
MRSKEEAQDYRYFPDPDLPPLELSESWLEQVRADLPELPDAMRERFTRDYGLTGYDASVLTADRELASYYDDLAKCLPGHAKLAANWVMGELLGRLNREGIDIADSPVSREALAELLRRIADGSVSGKIAKAIFDAIWNGEGTADQIIEARRLKQISDTGELERVVEQIVHANPAQVAEYRAGKEKAFNFFVGQAMKATKGQANPAQLSELLRKRLGSE